MRRHATLPTCIVMLVTSMLFAGCTDFSALPQPDDTIGPPATTSTPTVTATTPVSIRGKTFTVPFAAAGSADLKAGQSVTTAAIVRLFDGTPAEVPMTGSMTLPSSNITITQNATGEAASASRALPLNGTAKVRVAFVPGNAPNSCENAPPAAVYDIVLTTGVAGVVRERYRLTPPALIAIAENNLTLCTKITSDFDARLTLGDFILTFDDGTPPPTFVLRNLDTASIGLLVHGEVFNPSTLIAPGETRVVTLDVQAAPDADVVNVDLNDLGLESVATVHLATYSAWVSDLPDGITIATATLIFEDGTAPESVPLVLGVDTAEWSYDRADHPTRSGRVQHGRAQVLYGFKSSLDSTGEYEAYVYGVTVRLDPPRNLTGIQLAVADPDSFGVQRAAGALANWSAQSIPAITLVGKPGSPDGTIIDGVLVDDSLSAPTVAGRATGTVVNGASRESLAGVTITLNGTLTSTTTYLAGNFTISSVRAGDYTLGAALAGYAPAAETITLEPGEVATASLALFRAGTVTGGVVDAQTGQDLPGVQVSVQGSGALATTDGSGAFIIDEAPEGERTLSAVLAGYIPTTVPITVTADQSIETSIGMLKIGAGGDGVAVVLSWGESPRDLDLHVSGPDGSGGRFHIAYYALTPVGHASLDLDDTVSFGPKTVTVSPTQAGTYVPGEYRVWIHNFTGEASFDVSAGIVTLFAGGAQFAQYQVSGATGDATGTIWRVAEFTVTEDGTVSNITPLQTFESGTDRSEY